MAIIEHPMTLNGKMELDKELEFLVRVEREKLKSDIAEARSHGDLKENSEYHSAKEKQAIVEGRILEIQAKIGKAKVVDISKIGQSRIVFGATVTIYDIKKEASLTYQIVGEDEADSAQKKISYTSPLGKALIGREVGDEVTVKAPKGDIEFEVENIEYK